MTIKLRDYQQRAVDDLFDYWRNGGGNPCLELPTGAGKSIVSAEINRRIVTQWPSFRVINLTHQKELIEQNFQKMLTLMPSANLGVYSASVGRRDRNAQILFAGIQTVYNKARLLGNADLCVVDEAHLISGKADSMYGQFFKDMSAMRPGFRVCGLTATPFRLDRGMIVGGENPMFHDLLTSVSVAELIERGYLSPIVPKSMATTFDASRIAITGGDFNSGAADAAFNTDELNRAVVAETLSYGHDRQSWLVFATSVSHAINLNQILLESGINSAVLDGTTSKLERERTIGEFKAGRLRCLVNCRILTTGFDAPNVDLIAMAASTMSPGLFAQIAGRGLRISPETGKTNCLFLDFGGNAKRHGPIDDLRPPIKKARLTESDKTGDAPIKVCPEPECRTINAASAKNCFECGHEFPASKTPPKINATADDAPMLKHQGHSQNARGFALPGEPICEWMAERHGDDPGRTPTMKVTYLRPQGGGVKEWICFEHNGYAGNKARQWWRDHGGEMPAPSTVEDAIVRFSELRCPDRIISSTDGRYTRVASFLYDGDGEYSLASVEAVLQCLIDDGPADIDTVVQRTGLLNYAAKQSLKRLFRRGLVFADGEGEDIVYDAGETT